MYVYVYSYTYLYVASCAVLLLLTIGIFSNESTQQEWQRAWVREREREIDGEQVANWSRPPWVRVRARKRANEHEGEAEREREKDKCACPGWRFWKGRSIIFFYSKFSSLLVLRNAINGSDENSQKSDLNEFSAANLVARWLLRNRHEWLMPRERQKERERQSLLAGPTISFLGSLTRTHTSAIEKTHASI